MNSLEEVAGFQFEIDGVSIEEASGGAAAAAGFMMSSSASVTIGFSLSGATIPSGDYTLLYLGFIGDISTICVSSVIVSDPNGSALDYEIGECWVP